MGVQVARFVSACFSYERCLSARVAGVLSAVWVAGREALRHCDRTDTAFTTWRDMKRQI